MEKETNEQVRGTHTIKQEFMEPIITPQEFQPFYFPKSQIQFQQINEEASKDDRQEEINHVVEKVTTRPGNMVT